MKWINLFCCIGIVFTHATAQPHYDYSQLQREHLGRGMTAIRENASTVVLSWRYLSSDPMNEAFNVYRNGKKLNKKPLKKETFFKDTYADNKAALYSVKALKGNTETSYLLPANAPSGYQGCLLLCT